MYGLYRDPVMQIQEITGPATETHKYRRILRNWWSPRVFGRCAI